MFPIKDENPHFLTPVVTYGLIAANAAVWVLIQGLGTSPAVLDSVCHLGLIPGELLGRAPVRSVELGPAYACRLGEPAWITVLSSMFLHGGWGHLLGNMWFLWVFGNNVEDSMGHLRFALFYLLCGAVAAAFQVLSAPESPIPMVGASGAIGGVMGAYVVLYPRVRVHLLLWFGFYVSTVVVPAYFMLGYWFLIQLLLGAVAPSGGGGVAFWAHVGGFVAGALLVLGFRKEALVRRHPYYGWR